MRKTTFWALLLAFSLVLSGCDIQFKVATTENDSGTSAQQTEPQSSAAVTSPQTEAATENAPPPPTTAPPEPTVPPTTVPAETAPAAEYIGSLYTRQQLEAMENETKGYGPGYASGGNRAPYADGYQEQYGQYGANFIAPDSGCIYLTFDCGYEYFIRDENGNEVALTGLILDTLKEKNVKAVFFVTMSYCRNNPELVQRMIDEGHTVGNHSNSHPSMPSLSIDGMVQEIMSLHEYVQEHFGYTMTLFRPPMGEFSTRSLAVAQSLGYKTVHWSFAYADWDTANQPDRAEALDKIVSCHHSGAIFLLHAVSETNTFVLGDVIDAFAEKGYKLESFQ